MKAPEDKRAWGCSGSILMVIMGLRARSSVGSEHLASNQQMLTY